MQNMEEKIMNDFMKNVEDVPYGNIKKDAPDEMPEELKDFLIMCSQHRRERMTDNITVYDRLMQGIEELGERCEAYETEQDPEEKRKGIIGYSENLRTIANLVNARTNLVRMMMLDE